MKNRSAHSALPALINRGRQRYREPTQRFRCAVIYTGRFRDVMKTPIHDGRLKAGRERGRGETHVFIATPERRAAFVMRRRVFARSRGDLIISAADDSDDVSADAKTARRRLGGRGSGRGVG